MEESAIAEEERSLEIELERLGKLVKSDTCIVHDDLEKKIKKIETHFDHIRQRFLNS